MADAATRGIRALSFDAYGTLISGGTDDLVRLLDNLRLRHGLPMTTQDLLREREGLIAELDKRPFLAMRERDEWILGTLFERHHVREDVGRLAAALHEAHLRVDVYPGVRETLEALRAYPRVLVTNADVDMMEEVLRRTGLRFDGVVTSQSVKAYKPARILFETALSHLGVKPAEVLHVGDSFVADVVGAKRAGMRAAWVTGTTGLPPPAGAREAPDVTVPSVADLVPLLHP